MTDFTNYAQRPAGPNNQQLILMGLQHMSAGRMSAAEKCYRTVMQRDANPTTHFLLATMLPPVYASKDDLNQWRGRFIKQVDDLKKANLTLDLAQHLAVPTFTTAYQGMNDLSMHRALTSLYRPAADPPLQTRDRTAGSRIRVGFVSSYFRDHTIGRLNLGLVEHLSRDAFDVTVLSTAAHQDALAQRYRQAANSYVVMPSDLHAARRQIAALGLDLLFYTDLGMEPLTYTLAFSRLAPVQCVTWGHPDTTAIPTIDYFISSEELDSPDAQSFYSEKLIRLQLPAVYYHRPVLPLSPKGREQFDLPPGKTLYGCPQTLYKFHPDFDPVLAGILRGDEDGLLVLIKGQHQAMQDALMARFSRTMTDVVDRIRWVDRQDRNGFLSLNALLDVSLDPLHFGGGNTSYEALALGVPIVTLPSEYLRGRITYAQYRMVEMDDCIVRYPGEYIQKAIRLGTDVAYRDAIRKKILERNSALYENLAAVRGLEAFFRQALADG